MFSKSIPVQVGDTTVVVNITCHGSGKNFVHVHQNETTALAAARAVIAEQGGSILTLTHPYGRNIVFRLVGMRYEFDPNRIFTDVGIQNTLSTYGHYSKAAHQQVKKLAEAIVSNLPEGKIIAVHNNESYSMKDYYASQPLESDAEKLNVVTTEYYRNFFLVTQHDDFNRLTKLGFNSILQSKKVQNDGSLSVRMAKNHYVNVEAGYDQLPRQIQMLKRA